MIRRRPAPVLLVVLVTASITIGAAAGAPAALSGGSVRLKLTAAGPTQVVQGTSFAFTVTARNDGSSGTLAQVLVQLADPSHQSLDVRSWLVQLEPGPPQSIDFSVVSSQWFADDGGFELSASVNGVPKGNRLAFTVTPPTVLVPVFEDVSDTVGLSTILPNDYGLSHAAGAAWADVDLDGYPDLYVPSRAGPSQLWMNRPATGTFEEAAAAWGALNPGASGVAAVFADMDNDGDQDLYVIQDAIDPATAEPTMEGNRLYRNEMAQGQNVFTDVSAAAGVGTQGNGVAAAWGDYDGDSYLDLYVVNNNTYNEDGQPGQQITYQQPDHLFHNEGDGTFTDVTCEVLPGNDPTSGFCADPAMGGSTGSGFQAVWFDYDLDGDQDLYLAQDYFLKLTHKDVDRLYRNDGFDPGSGTWTFTEICALHPNADACVPINAMGIAIGDYNGDLLPDIAVSNTGGAGGNYLLRNDGGDAFTNVAPALGVERISHYALVKTTTWGMGFEDFNLDGIIDLYVTAGSNVEQYNQPNELFVGAPGATFVDLSAPSHSDDPGVAHGVAFADYDRDGLMDMYVVNVFGSGEVSLPILYRNVTSTPGHWLEVDLIGTTVNRDACGARVVVTAGGSRQARWLLCGSSQGSGDDPILHFGLPRSGSVRVRVDWPGGGHQTVRATTDALLVIQQA